MALALASISGFVAAVVHARSIDVAAYTLGRGEAREALLTAARTGAHVRVRLEGAPVDDAQGFLGQSNAATVALLAAAGADAALTTADEPMLHLKAAVVDGVAWLDDRNWTTGGHATIVCDDDAADVEAVRAALRGEHNDGGALRTTKAAAQALEVEVVRAAGRASLVVESESFGSGAMYNALLARAESGLPTRLLVAGREVAQADNRGATELRRLTRLAALGVEVRTGAPGGGDVAEKLAVAGESGWVGSANATYAFGEAGEQRDWGLVTHEAPIVDGLRAAFERNWMNAHALGDGTFAGAPCDKPSATTSRIHPPDLSCGPPSTRALGARE